MRIVSWNVNGIRAAYKKGLCAKLTAFNADIIGLQETKASEEQVLELCQDLVLPYRYAHGAKKAGYSGVALFSKYKPKEVIYSLHDDIFDNEGRLILAIFDRFILANVYFPNGAGKNGDNSRVPYKLAFYDKLFDLLAQFTLPILVMGDFNTAHKEIDIARPKENAKHSGFLPIEREHFSLILNRGYIDTFRHFHQEPHQYSWWNMRFKARERNIGWRIDGVLANTLALDLVKNAFIWQDVMGSDHCPVGVEFYGPSLCS